MANGKQRNMKWEEVRWIQASNRKYRGGIVVRLILGLISVALQLAGIVAFRYLLDDIFGGYVSAALSLAGIILGMYLMRIGIEGVAGSLSARLYACIRGDIWYQTYDNILKTDWEALHGFRTGDLAERMDRDIDLTASAAAGWLPDFAAGVARFGGIMWILFQMDAQLAIFVFICGPLSVLISRVLVRKMYYHQRYLREAGGQMTSFNQESLQHIGLIQAFDMQDFFRLRLTEIQKKYRRNHIELQGYLLSISFFISLTGLTAIFLCYGWSIYRMWSGAASLGTLIISFFLIEQMRESFSHLMEMASDAAEAIIAAGKIMELFELPGEAKLDEEWMEFIHMREKDGLSILFDQVDFCYRNGDPVLEQVSWEAHPGEWVGIAGGSGEGKTTLIRLMLGLILPTDGVLRLSHIQGLNCLVSAATRPFLAYVPQENSLFPGTVADNLRLGRADATEDELWDALRIACAADFVMELSQGLHTLLGEQGVRLSEGQVQRLAIARAVVRDAPICLLDEATSALDPDTEREVLSNLKQVWRTKTCILTTHRIHVLGRCDRVYRIEETGLSPSGEYYDMIEPEWEDVPYRLTELIEAFAPS